MCPWSLDFIATLFPSPLMMSLKNYGAFISSHRQATHWPCDIDINPKTGNNYNNDVVDDDDGDDHDDDDDSDGDGDDDDDYMPMTMTVTMISIYLY